MGLEKGFGEELNQLLHAAEDVLRDAEKSAFDKTEQYQGAVELYAAALKKAPPEQQQNIQTKLADTLLKLAESEAKNNPDEARKHYQQVLDLTNSEAKNNPAEARKHYQQVADLTQDEPGFSQQAAAALDALSQLPR